MPYPSLTMHCATSEKTYVQVDVICVVVSVLRSLVLSTAGVEAQHGTAEPLRQDSLKLRTWIIA